ncbi:glycoside hydrolase family 2 protein [Streptomyces sp. PpalLS-921]|uniref:glycoside hydrolase family 2 protein n=1 Tax=Streptomyces sp. PpalLS-921 TaxID=1839772 RepID=UPI00081DB664|nr:glycoside hydrolase family 2 TIM barrel-domain containing protein [Streptomyces sp. PpalLS-921]SCE29407.1 beta-mannosidase [Streptomyces sp. PpalLS-921]
MSPRHLPLNDGWTLTADGPVPVELPAGGIPATVPGCVHTDLLAAGLIDDPYLDDNETRLGWTGRTDWTYRTDFHWSEDGHTSTDLCFDGLDTVATVLLNGTEVGSTANQHRSYRFPVRPLLREGANTLQVRFTAPYTYAEALREKLGDRPGAYAEPYAFIRKMACNFGWDWGPTLVTSGIRRPVALESWTGHRIAAVTVLGDLDDAGVPRLSVTLDVERDGAAPVSGSVGVVGAGVVFIASEDEDRLSFTLQVPDAEPWWPHSHGAQPLYDVTVRLGEDTWNGRTGFRGVTLEREAFRVSVNGEPVFVRGVNWIPDDCFPTRLTRQRISDRLDQAVAAHVNLVRVWGGGLYESDDFYELCDEKGLLVWQDFPFACAAYPEEQPLYDEVAAEVRENLVRLSPHPSLVLWCGNNENLEGHADWGWQERLDGRTWGYGYYHDLLPALCAEIDPTRPYWPGSPYSGSPELPPQDPSRGTVHLWDVWNRVDYRHYADTAHRFVAEFGFQGPPAYATLRRAVSGPLSPESPLVAHHQKAEGGDAKLLRGLGDHLRQPRPGDFDDWHWLTQLNQARAVAFGIRHFRSHTPYCMGSIVWQLNDCWPVISWAAVDGDGRRKPLWYALRQVYADRLMAVRDGSLHLVNDAAGPWKGTLRLTRRGLDGTVLAEEETVVSTAPRDVTRIPLPASLATPEDGTREVLVAELDGVRAVEFYEEDTRLALPEARYDVSVVAQGDDPAAGYRVTVTARTLLRDLALFPDRLDGAAEVDDMLVTLLPGESAVLHVTGAVLEDPDALGRAPVLRCVNDVVGP